MNSIKLVIWDLDETFWKGTLSEGNVKPISFNIQLLKGLVDRGIMNSIVSKNDQEKVFEVLKSWNVLDFFVFPKISWQPKGEIVNSLLIEMKLRAENVVFVDDNLSNLAEVRFYNEGITCFTPDQISNILSLPAFKGKDDLQHTRLRQYHIMEKQSKAKARCSNNEEFLVSSHIKLQICKDCFNEEERILELIERTNQLNYTKCRISSEDLHKILMDDNLESGYLKVRDDYGDYGIVGFYTVQGHRLLHFLFSCRTLGLGVENYLYRYLGYPEVNIVGDVATPLSKDTNVYWIEKVDSVEKELVYRDKQHNMLLVGGCDLEQMRVYLKSDYKIDTEFATIVNGNEIRTSDTCTLVNTLELDETTKKRLCDHLAFLDYSISFGTKMFSGEYDVIIFSVVDDYIRGMYRHNSDNFYVGLGGYFDQKSSFAMYPSANFSFLKSNFTFCGREDVTVFKDNLKKIITNIPSKTAILLINGVELDVSQWIGKDRVERNVEMNKAVDEIVEEYSNVSLIDMRKIVTSLELLSNKDNRHFKRPVYYELAKVIVEKCDELFCRKDVLRLSEKYGESEEINVYSMVDYVKTRLKKMGFRNPSLFFKQLYIKYKLKKFNQKYSKIDYFNFEELVKMPDFMGLPAPYEDNISYGMCNPIRYLFKGKVRLNYDYIEHGLCYAEAAPNLLNILSQKKLGRIFTYSNRRKEQLERLMSKAGYHNEVIALGPIITGAENFYPMEKFEIIKKRIGKTLLVFPMHSWPGVDNEFDKDELIQEIERIRPQFDTILICLYYMDIRNNKHMPFIEKGYTIVCNGSRFDSHFISRHRDIIELSDVTMSNGIGTHVGYSIALNRPHYYFKQEMHQKIGEAYSAESAEQEFRVGFEDEFVRTFGHFSYEITEEQRQFVKLYWGDYRLDE